LLVRSVGFVVIAAFLIFPVTAAANDSAVVSAPVLAPGDTWTYHTNTSLATGLSLAGRVKLTVTAHRSTQVEGRIYDAYVMAVGGSGTANGMFSTQIGTTQASGDWTIAGQEVFDARGLKLLLSVLDLEANGTLHTNPIPLPFALSVQNTTSFPIDNDPWQFPLAVGATGVVTSRMNFSEDFRIIYYGSNPTPTHSAGQLWWNVTYAIGTSQGVDTPAGHFDAYPIRQTFADGSVTTSYYAPAAGNTARTEARNHNATVGTADLVAYRYQALEPPTFLGLTTDRWAIVVLAIGGAGVLFAWWFRRKRRLAREQNPPPT
jgi:hypothetical protein